MAKYGILSDIHGHHAALKLALERFETAGVEKVLCLGDIFGYGPEPRRCLETLAQYPRVTCVAGNLDRQFRDLEPQLDKFVRTLPKVAVVDGLFVLVHCGLANAAGYIHYPEDFQRNFLALEERFPHQSLCFFGHTHTPAMIGADGTVEDCSSPRTLALKRGTRYLINPGSVGQPRGGSQASCGIFDSDAWSMAYAPLDL